MTLPEWHCPDTLAELTQPARALAIVQTAIVAAALAWMLWRVCKWR